MFVLGGCFAVSKNECSRNQTHWFVSLCRVVVVCVWCCLLFLFVLCGCVVVKLMFPVCVVCLLLPVGLTVLFRCVVSLVCLCCDVMVVVLLLLFCCVVCCLSALICLRVCYCSCGCSAVAKKPCVLKGTSIVLCWIAVAVVFERVLCLFGAGVLLCQRT